MVFTSRGKLPGRTHGGRSPTVRASRHNSKRNTVQRTNTRKAQKKTGCILSRDTTKSYCLSTALVVDWSPLYCRSRRKSVFVERWHDGLRKGRVALLICDCLPDGCFRPGLSLPVRHQGPAGLCHSQCVCERMHYLLLE